MTCGELIKKLESFDRNLKVTIFDINHENGMDVQEAILILEHPCSDKQKGIVCLFKKPI